MRVLQKTYSLPLMIAHRKVVSAPVLFIVATVFSVFSSLQRCPAADESAKDVPIRVTAEGEGPFAGATGTVIEAAAREAHRRGGGVVHIAPGTYTLHREIDLSGLRGVRIIGTGKVVLRAAKQESSAITAEASEGDMVLSVDAVERFPEGTTIEIHSPGRRGTKPSGEPYQVPYIMARVAGHEDGALRLAEPLKYPAPAGATVIPVFNGVIIRGEASDLLLSDLTIDMNRDHWPVVPLNHVYHCGVFAAGPYSYEKGPTGPPVKDLRIVRCTVRNSHYRGIVLYSTVHTSIVDCRIENTDAEGIVFDHFCQHGEAVGNTLVNCQNIELNDASDCVIAYNRIEKPDVGIVVWQWCTQPGLNERNLLIGNEIIEPGGEGISLKSGADDNLVSGNTIENSGGAGIVVRGNANLILGNRLSGTGGTPLVLEGEGNFERDNISPKP